MSDGVICSANDSGMIDCGTTVDYDRLRAYPSAKRCLPCQQRREKTRAPNKYTGR